MSNSSSASIYKNNKKFGINMQIQKRFYFSDVKSKQEDYTIYKGIDKLKTKWVHIYAKHAESAFPMSNKYKQNVRNQISPKILWTGQYTIDKTNCYLQVHQAYGPSLHEMFSKVNKALSQTQSLHLLLQLIKLLEKIHNQRLFSAELNMHNILFDQSPNKNELYLLNCFHLKKKLDPPPKNVQKYSSRGVHLGLVPSIKDDLQSICYLLIHIHTNGQFLADRHSQQYESAKLNLATQKYFKLMPKLFQEFYNYVINLTYQDQINFFNWKNIISKTLSKEIIHKPYGWMITKVINQPELQCKVQQQTTDYHEMDEQIHHGDSHRRLHQKCLLKPTSFLRSL